MLVIGLTGGIGSGKSTVATLFEELGTTIIDTDIIAREVVAPGQPALAQISDHFGSHFIQADGNLDRTALSTYVFQNALARTWLEQLLHPLIRAEVQQRINPLAAPYCIVAIPLLIETLPNPMIQRILVVDCAENIQIQRAMARDHLSAEQVRRIIYSQASREQRQKAADDIIQNEGSYADLALQVSALHKEYVHLGTTTRTM